MSVTPRPPWFPEFQPGQVVTAEQLNQLQDHLVWQHRSLVCRVLGHGILEGLDAHLDPVSRRLVIAPGVAVDRHGHRVVVDTPIHVDPCRVRAEQTMANYAHPAIDAERAPRDGYTLVLVRRTRTEADDDSLGGARIHDESALVFVPGRLGLHPRPPLYDVRPLVPPRGLVLDNPIGFVRAFDDRRRALARALEQAAVPEYAIQGVRRLRLSGGPTPECLGAADLLAIAALNDVVYSAWQYARAGEYQRIHGVAECAPEQAGPADPRAGIALGWLYHDADDGWCWDERWRSGFVVGATTLEHVTGYAPATVKALCARRMAAAAEGVLRLVPDPAASEYDAWTIGRAEYEAGTTAWLPGIEWDRPCRWSTFWPIDPLRGTAAPPAAALPRDDVHVRTAPVDAPAPCTSPSLLDAANDPYAFAGYANADRVDPARRGVLALTGLLGRDVGEVDERLQELRSGGGDAGHRIVPDSDVDVLAGYAYCLVVAPDVPLAIVYSRRTHEVIGFAVADEGPAQRPLPRRRAWSELVPAIGRLARWLKGGRGRARRRR